MRTFAELFAPGTVGWNLRQDLAEKFAESVDLSLESADAIAERMMLARAELAILWALKPEIMARLKKLDPARFPAKEEK